MGRREKLVVTFDESSRKEFVTGFRKRKQERRKKAIDEKAAIVKEARRQQRAKRRAAEAEVLVVSTEVMQDPLLQAPGSASELGIDGAAAGSRTLEDDDFSRRAFGADAVVVTTKFGLDGGDDDDESLLEELAEGRGGKSDDEDDAGGDDEPAAAKSRSGAGGFKRSGAAVGFKRSRPQASREGGSRKSTGPAPKDRAGAAAKPNNPFGGSVIKLAAFGKTKSSGKSTAAAAAVAGGKPSAKRARFAAAGE